MEVRDVLRKCVDGAYGRKVRFCGGFWVNFLRRKRVLSGCKGWVRK